MHLYFGTGSDSGVNMGLVSLSNFASWKREAQDLHMRSTQLIPICSLPQEANPLFTHLLFLRPRLKCF